MPTVSEAPVTPVGSRTPTPTAAKKPRNPREFAVDLRRAATLNKTVQSSGRDLCAPRKARGPAARYFPQQVYFE
jgi:hypothetical protein